jgi:hypothetical protein
LKMTLHQPKVERVARRRSKLTPKRLSSTAPHMIPIHPHPVLVA